MANAKITLSTTVKVLENTSEVASRSTSGSIDIDEYTQIIDTVVPDTTDKVYTFGGLTTFDFISIESDKDITIKFNSVDDTAIALKTKIVSGTVQNASFVASASGFTAFYISNSSISESAKVKIIFGKYSA